MHLKKIPSQEQLIELICNRLIQEQYSLADAFSLSINEIGVRYFLLDDLLPLDIADAIACNFPALDQMRLMQSFRERKYTSKNFDNFHPLMKAITFAMQDPRVISLIENITKIEGQIPDPSLYAGGLSAMTKGHFLGVHIDNSHESTRKYYRTLNLLYYVSPGWSENSGGNLQLWNSNVSHAINIASKYNRLVVMETHPLSWHSVSKVNVNYARRCVSNYYFSPTSPVGSDYFNVTSFSAPISEPFRRIALKVDTKVRQVLRFFVPDGVGKRDIYQSYNSKKE